MQNMMTIALVTAILALGGSTDLLPGLAAESDLALPPDSHSEATVRYTGAGVAKWEAKKIDDDSYSMSPMITFGPDVEVNHHRVTVRYAPRPP